MIHDLVSVCGPVVKKPVLVADQNYTDWNKQQQLATILMLAWLHIFPQQCLS